MGTIGILLILGSIGFFIAGMIKPQLAAKIPLRLTITLICLVIFVIGLMMFGLADDETSELENTEVIVQQETTTQQTRESFIASCEKYTYKEIARNPNSYNGKNVYFTGKVIQVQESGKDVVLRVDVTKNEYDWWDDTVFVEYKRSDKNESRILDGDIIKMYGTLNGIKKYDAIFGNEVSIPYMIAKYIEIVK